MAIQNRRGSYADFGDGSNLVDGEFGMVQSGDTNTADGTGIYAAPVAGTVHRLLVDDDKTELAGDIAQNAQDISTLNSNLTNTQSDLATLSASAATVLYWGWAQTITFKCGRGGLLIINGGGTVFSFWWPGGTFTPVSIKGDAASAYTWNYSNGAVTVTASGNRTWTFVGG